MKRGDILMDVMQNHLVIVDTFTQKENYYSIGYIRLSEIEISGFQPYYHRGIKTNRLEACFRLATDKELEEVKRVIAVMLNRLTLVRKPEKIISRKAMKLKEEEKSIVEKGMILTGRQFKSSIIIVHSVSNRLVKYVEVNRIGLGINVDSIIREASDGTIYVHYRGSTAYEIERVINKLRSMLNTLTPFSDKSRLKDHRYYQENFENEFSYAIRDDSEILKDIANLMSIPAPNPPITEENKWKNKKYNRLLLFPKKAISWFTTLIKKYYIY